MTSSVSIVVPGPAGARPAHRKATIASVATAIQFDIADPESDLSSLGVNWAEQPRAGRKALTQLGAPKLAAYQIKATFVGNDPQQSIEPTLLRLKSLAHGPHPVALGYGSMSGHTLMTQTGHWVIRDCSIAVQARQQGTNDATRAVATIDLLEANVPKWTRPASMAAAPPANNVSGSSTLLDSGVRAPTPTSQLQGGSTTYVTAAGETLPQVSLAVYGNPNVWRSIADLNKILDPRNLAAGLRLLLP